MGSTTLLPGEKSYVGTTFTMNGAMAGPHHFLFMLETNDPQQNKIELHVKANFTVK